MSAASVMDSSARLGRLARFALAPSAPDVGEMTGADAGLDQVLAACSPETQAAVAEAAELAPLARVRRAIELWMGVDVGAVGVGA